MTLKCGIVGLPNVGKSTLFNAITNTVKAEAANYPFCTIEPNIGKIAVPDERLKKLATIAGSATLIPNTIEIVDIAGLVAGASKGEGLGNQFLGNIKEVDAILHVVRCFDDDNIIHVANKVDPINDIETIETELLLADLTSIEKIMQNYEKKSKNGKDKDALNIFELSKKIFDNIAQGIQGKDIDLTDDELKKSKQFCLLTMKPMIYVANVDENSIKDGNKYTKQLSEFIKNKNLNAKMIIVSSKIEMEISSFDEIEKKEYLNSIGCEKSGLDKLVQEGYNLLGLITFFTIGPKEAHAWSILKDKLAPEAAGVIHTDFQKGFIRAETISYNDYIQYNGEDGCKNVGKLRVEGKEYVLQDGDIFHFRFNI